MQTFKTAVVVVLMLAVVYGAYVGINGSETPLPPELEDMVADLDFSTENGANGFSLPDDGSDDSFGSNSFTSASPNAGTANSSGSLLPPNSTTTPGLGSPSNSTLAPPQTISGNSATGNSFLLGGPATPSTGGSNQSLQPNNSIGLPPASNNGLSGGLASPSPTVTSTSSPEFSIGPQDFSNTSATPGLSLPAVHGDSVNTSGDLVAFNSSANNPLSGNGSVGLTSMQPATAGNGLLPGNSGSPNTVTPSNGLAPLGTEVPSLSTTNPTSFANSGDGLPNSATSKSFENALAAAKEQIERGELKDALATLSLFYDAPELTQQQRFELLEILDPLAGEVVFSQKHYLELPYTVANGEQLSTIAAKYDVPDEVFARINGVANPSAILPGTQLKVFRGPFRAEVNLNRNELTLFVGELYAGRFPISIGTEPTPREGIFQVVDKQLNRNYYGLGGTQVPGNDPRNPYGGYWIDLGQELCIHGSPSKSNADNPSQGCISLAPNDAMDLFGMLSRGSQIQIRR